MQRKMSARNGFPQVRGLGPNNPLLARGGPAYGRAVRAVAVFGLAAFTASSCTETTSLNSDRESGTVLFKEDWESGDLRRWSDGPGGAGEFEVVKDPALALDGEHLLRVIIPAGEHGGYLNLFDPLFPGSGEIYISAGVRLAEGWSGTSRLFNIRAANPNRVDWPWVGLGHAGICPDGNDRVRIGAGSFTDLREIRWYNYWHGMATEPDGTTCWGRHHPSGREVYLDPLGSAPADQWFTVEIHAKLNTPGQADGFARMWVNGHPHSTWEGEAWTTSEDLRFNIFQIDLRGAAPVSRTIYFDRMVLSTAPPNVQGPV